MEKTIKDTILNRDKIVLKIGTSSITNEDGTVDLDFIENLAYQIKTLRDMGKEIILVSSGARIAGVSTIGKWSRMSDVQYKQALCAIGQVELMGIYRRIFAKHDIHIGQILLTSEDFDNKDRRLNIRNTLFTLMDEEVLPIINENDTVSIDEIKIGDNDVLSANTTVLWGGELLIILSDIDGIYDKNPSEHEDAKLISLCEDAVELEKNISTKSSGEGFGTGGIETKIRAATIVNKFGIPMVVAMGKKENIVLKLLNEEEVGTLFLGKEVDL